MEAKQTYTKPVLRRYGDIRTITQTNIIPGKEFGAADGLWLFQNGEPVPAQTIS
jgi:hypothetical protein